MMTRAARSRSVSSGLAQTRGGSGGKLCDHRQHEDDGGQANEQETGGGENMRHAVFLCSARIGRAGSLSRPLEQARIVTRQGRNRLCGFGRGKAAIEPC